MQHTHQYINGDGYVLLLCEGWSESEYSRYGQIIGGLVDATAAASRFDSNTGADNAVFRIINIKQSKQVTFKLR